MRFGRTDQNLHTTICSATGGFMTCLDNSIECPAQLARDEPENSAGTGFDADKSGAKKILN
jgi:hypothetical protein